MEEDGTQKVRPTTRIKSEAPRLDPSPPLHVQILVFDLTEKEIEERRKVWTEIRWLDG
jgi:hypothetical protein